MIKHFSRLLQADIEDIAPDFLWGLREESLYPGEGHSADQWCPNCLREAVGRGLPLWDGE